MKYGPLSRKQKTAMLWWCAPETRDRDAVICDGAVRSGKTLAMTVGFVLWSMTGFRGQVFALCGKTIESLRRNVTNLLPQWLGSEFTVTERRQDNRITISRRGVENTYYLFGGRDESSAALIQGITLAGALLDEVALMPRSFVEQTLARCSVAGSRLFFSCNPAAPGHWFHREWIEQAEGRNALYLHFTMDDNLSLSPAIRERYRRMYTGVFYRRYVLGEWCAAEGLVYPFSREEITTEETPKGPVTWYISVDYGTRNPCSMGLWALEERTGRAIRVAEDYYDGRRGGQRTDGEHYEALCRLAGDRPIAAVIVDPSALSFITLIRREGRFHVRKAKNDVLTGIRTLGQYLKSGRIRLSPRCHDALRELENYRWDDASGLDKPIKEDDHAMDEMRYFAATVMRN